MARSPLLQLSAITLGFGGAPLFDGLDLVVQPGDRVALVGRNGAGKSTLLKVMAGLVEPDRGARVLGQGVRTGYLPQDPDFAGFATLGDYTAADLEPGSEWRAEAAAEGLAFDPARDPQAASGGERRRAALARLLASEPELMLLDEPTNHLDIAAISWLEAHLAATRAAYVLISHDRAFLRALSRAVMWIDRRVVRRMEQGFAHFDAWQERVWAEEDAARHKLDRRIEAEGRWAVEGISARRKRNQGRLRALEGLRAERAAQIRRQGTAAMAFEGGETSGKRVIEAVNVAKSFGGRTILRPFSLKVMRADRVAIVGPNGAGKTTLLDILTGKLAPDSGEVVHGTNLRIAVFDQNRSSLDPEASLWETLTGTPQMRVSGAADQVMVRGTPRHVVGYLKDFLFDEAQARQPVRALSGGEKARLALARIMAEESNLLVLDEPTNDLDVETLDLLQDLLGSYPGTVLLVSHDRDFLDRVATVTVALEGDGRAVVYAGGWSDMLAQGGGGFALAQTQKAPAPPRVDGPAASPKATAAASPGGQGAKGAGESPGKTRLSFTESHRLAALPDEIARLEAEIARLAEALSDPDLHARDPAKAARAGAALASRQEALEAAEEEWLALAERAEATQRQ